MRLRGSVQSQNLNQSVDALQILRFVEENKRRLPELFSVHSRPSQLLTFNLLSPLFKGGKLVIVLVEEFVQLLKHVGNVLIDPWSVLEFNHDVQSVDHGQVFEALRVVFQVLED